MVHHHIGDCMFVSSLMKHFQTNGLEEMDQFMATSFTRHHFPGLSMGLCEGYRASNKGAGHN